MNRSIALLVVTFATAGCGSTPGSPSDSIVGTSWALVSLQESGAAPVTPGTPSRYTLRFENDGQLSVVSDCNTCVGAYSAGSTLQIASITCTRTVCSGGSLDSPYTSTLQRAQSVVRDGDDLTIKSGDAILHFTE